MFGANFFPGPKSPMPYGIRSKLETPSFTARKIHIDGLLNKAPRKLDLLQKAENLRRIKTEISQSLLIWQRRNQNKATIQNCQNLLLKSPKQTSKNNQSQQGRSNYSKRKIMSVVTEASATNPEIKTVQVAAISDLPNDIIELFDLKKQLLNQRTRLRQQNASLKLLMESKCRVNTEMGNQCYTSHPFNSAKVQGKFRKGGDLSRQLEVRKPFQQGYLSKRLKTETIGKFDFKSSHTFVPELRLLNSYSASACRQAVNQFGMRWPGNHYEQSTRQSIVVERWMQVEQNVQ